MTAPDQAALDAAYNNSAAVADSADQVTGWAARSAAFRAAHPALLDQAYGPLPRQKMDTFRCGADSAWACVQRARLASGSMVQPAVGRTIPRGHVRAQRGAIARALSERQHGVRRRLSAALRFAWRTVVRCTVVRCTVVRCTVV